MRFWFLCIALTACAIVSIAGQARALETLAYSFEANVPAGDPPSIPPGGPDGFFGLGATVSQDTIGATNGLSSMKYVAGNDGFVGARTETVIPAALNDPPGVDYVLFDAFIPAAYGGTFADIGITLFGHRLNAPGGAVFGLQTQFQDTISLAALPLGQSTNLRIDLDTSVGPYRPGESFNAIFGPGPNDLTVASAFQFFISKNAGQPITVYIDNVRLVSVPEPASFGLAGLALAGLAMIGRRRR